KIIPYEIANKLIFNHKDELAIVDCPCRLEKKTAGRKYCEPVHTCIFLGKVGVDFVTTHMPRMHGRRVAKEEVLKLLEEQQKRGVAFTLWFKDATGYRGGVLCCCCACCCAGVEAEKMTRKLPGMKPLRLTAPSGYSAVVDVSKCRACGTCVAVCPYDAREVVDIDGEKKLRLYTELCMGCGACVSVCPQQAASLMVDPSKGKVLDIAAIMEMAKKQPRMSNQEEQTE
ncbi:MAG TPA: 4Fe-4S dicluster domain-containing protein, partial [Dehalococcoidia bacterium]|nr:4Fe-4S dicluster domain-containing protein [Dehalococcoidia bacterium]